MMKNILLILTFVTQILYSQKQSDLSLKNLNGKVKFIEIKYNGRLTEQLSFNKKGFQTKKIEFTFDEKKYSESKFYYNFKNNIKKNKITFFENDTISGKTIEKRKYKKGKLFQIEKSVNGKITYIKNIFYNSNKKIIKETIVYPDDNTIIKTIFKYNNSNLMFEEECVNDKLITKMKIKYDDKRRKIEIIELENDEILHKYKYKYKNDEISKIFTYNYENELIEIEEIEKKDNVLINRFYNSNNELQTKWISKFKNNSLTEFINIQNGVTKITKYKRLYDNNRNIIKNIITNTKNEKSVYEIEIEYYK